MAVAVGPKTAGYPGAGGPIRGNSDNVDFATGYVSPISYSNSSRFPLRTSSQKLTLLTSAKTLGNYGERSAGSPKSSKQPFSGGQPAHVDTNMTSYSPNSTLPVERTRSESRLARLHKRASSGSSLPPTPSPLNPSQSQFTTPYEDSRVSTPTPPSNSSFKSRPYIRKSSAKDDENQGRLDLSKSVSESGYLPGLGIQDYGSRTASEVTFSHTRRLPSHTRTTSGGSQVSVASRSFTPTQPFIHPMRQTPYTPSGQSYTSSMNDDEAHESSDIVTDDGIISPQPFRSRRSESISSMPHIQPTPLSQSHTAADLGYVPKANVSQSNLSIKSGRSGKSSRSRLGRRSRRNTERSDDAAGRASLDKAFSFVSRRSNTEPEPLTRDEKIRQKRQQFNDREASKDRKQYRQEIKRRETDEARSVKQTRKSSLSQTERPRLEQQSSSKIQSMRKVARRDTEKSDELRARSYDDARPANLTALPKQAVTSEEQSRRSGRAQSGNSGTWPRFSTWLQTRLLSCGTKG